LRWRCVQTMRSLDSAQHAAGIVAAPMSPEGRNGHSATAGFAAVPALRGPIELELTYPAFVGPLGLLLELIEGRRLPITEVSIAEVADQYLERMRSLAGASPDLLSDFLVIAARLLVIKSRALLPSRPAEQIEESPAADLERRLIEYRLFRDAAERLRQIEESGRRSYPRRPAPETAVAPEPPLGPIPPESLRAAMIRMLKALRVETEPLEMPPQVTVRERIEQLMAMLASRGAATFSEISGYSVPFVVATFLAVLELVRQGVLSASQQEPFAEISLSLAVVPAE
jgi:segregation and condensation protein A